MIFYEIAHLVVPEPAHIEVLRNTLSLSLPAGEVSAHSVNFQMVRPWVSINIFTALWLPSTYIITNTPQLGCFFFFTDFPFIYGGKRKWNCLIGEGFELQGVAGYLFKIINFYLNRILFSNIKEAVEL